MSEIVTKVSGAFSVPRGLPCSFLFPSGPKKCPPSFIGFDLGGQLHSNSLLEIFDMSLEPRRLCRTCCAACWGDQTKEPFGTPQVVGGKNCRNRLFFLRLGTTCAGQCTVVRPDSIGRYGEMVQWTRVIARKGLQKVPALKPRIERAE